MEENTTISTNENHDISRHKEDYSSNSQQGDKVSFILPEINRDQQIFLGQSIIALIGVNMPHYFKDEDNKENVGLMFIDILRHYNISIEDLYRMDLIENELDPEFEYDLDIRLDYSILRKTEI